MNAHIPEVRVCVHVHLGRDLDDLGGNLLPSPPAPECERFANRFTDFPYLHIQPAPFLSVSRLEVSQLNPDYITLVKELS